MHKMILDCGLTILDFRSKNVNIVKNYTMKKLIALFLLTLFLISCSSTPRYGCNPRRCNVEVLQ